MPDTSPKIFTVSELTRNIKLLLEDRFPFVWVEGEISNLRIPSSGHCYFTLKDANAQVAGVMFRNAAQAIKFDLRDGLNVVASGQISVYEKSGQYQVICRQLMPKGLGALQLAFEQLKQRLAREGLFDPARKRPIPRLPQRIGLITSPTGAAIRDFLNIINRRFFNLRIVIHPVRVQGDGAAAEIAAAIEQFNALHASGELPMDVLIVTRGGGSLEDLWAFNEEVAARAIFHSAIPVISAVGHEIDFTIADFVADLRAPTPSAAAELVVKTKTELRDAIQHHHNRLNKDLRLRLTSLRQRLVALSSSYVFRQPAEVIRQYQMQVDDLMHRLRQGVDNQLTTQRTRISTAKEKFRLLSPQSIVTRYRDRVRSCRQRLDIRLVHLRQFRRQQLDHVRARLDLLSPNATIRRGYSITMMKDTGAIVRGVADAQPGAIILTRVADGEIESQIKRTKSGS